MLIIRVHGLPRVVRPAVTARLRKNLATAIVKDFPDHFTGKAVRCVFPVCHADGKHLLVEADAEHYLDHRSIRSFATTIGTAVHKAFPHAHVECVAKGYGCTTVWSSIS